MRADVAPWWEAFKIAAPPPSFSATAGLQQASHLPVTATGNVLTVACLQLVAMKSE